MTILVPSQNGIIVRKSPRTVDAINALRHLNRGMERNEDAHLAGFWLGGNGHDVHHHLESMVLAHGLHQGVDFVLTAGSHEGVLGPMPEWLQENEEPVSTFSVPGTAGPARSAPRPSREQEAVARAQGAAARAKEAATALQAAQRAGDEAALRRWPELADGDPARFLGECWALVEFVESSRTGGPARRWVESKFPAHAWHISVPNGYTNELRDALTAYYRDGPSAELLAVARCRAGQYIAGLEAGAASRTVDLRCYEAWKSAHFVHPGTASMTPES